MISLKPDAKLTILMPHQNKALSMAIAQATPDQLEQMHEGKDVKSLLNSLFQDKIASTKSDQVLLNILKNNSVFKQFGNFTDEIKSILNTLKNDPDLAPKLSKLQESLHSISTLDVSTLKGQIANSGVFMESKIASALVLQTPLEESLSHDVKFQLLQLSDELKTLNTPASNELQTQLDKLVTHIDYHQLLSHLDASNSLYFPFAWDQLEEGSLAFKKRDGEKFYCEINLTLKEYGKIDLIMALYDENQLEIQAHTEQTQLKELIQEHLSALKTILMEAGINPRAIRVYDKKEAITPSASAYAAEEGDFHTGFEVKG